MSMVTDDKQSEKESPVIGREAPMKPPRAGWRVFRIGCLGLLLLMCAGISSLAFALQGGPVNVDIPIVGTLKIGSDDFVLSNYSFQNGTTYYFDIDGGGIRNIIQVEYMKDTKSLQLVLHHATQTDENDSTLLTTKLP